MTQVIDDIFNIQIPMPRNPLKYLNSYFIKGENYNLIIDTGLNHPEAEKILFSAIDKLKFFPENTKLIITHMHADHCGLGAKLNKKGFEVWVNPIDGKIINNPTHWEKMIEFAKKLGMPLDRLDEAKMQHPGYRFRPMGKIEYNDIQDGDIFDLGNFRFRAIHTPGHTQGHMCLLEEQKKIFVSGDHILFNITPNISQWEPNSSPLQDYLQSLKKVRELEVELVLPGHRRIFRDLKARVDELFMHHKRRLKEVLEIVLDHPGLSAYDVASFMSWDMDYKSWDEFPMGQRWFATGEAQAHLNYLCEQGKLRFEENQVIRYYPN